MNTKDMLDELRELERRALELLGEKPNYSHYFVSTIDNKSAIGIRFSNHNQINAKGDTFIDAIINALALIEERSQTIFNEPRLREILGVDQT